MEVPSELITLGGTLLVGIVGYLSRTKADVIILKRDLRTAFKLIDKLQNQHHPCRGSPDSVCTRHDAPEKKEK
jgi:hypothetical protein